MARANWNRPDFIEGEIWKDVVGYEGHYVVSNLGRIKHLERKIKAGNKFQFDAIMPEILLTQFVSLHGYFRVCLMKDGKKKKHASHRVVAQAFIPNIDNKPQVNHKDCIKTNNVPENLEWCTQTENQRHARKNKPNWYVGQFEHKSGAEHLMARSVIQMDKDGNEIKKWSYTKEASDSLEIGRTSIIHACTGRNKTAGGFKWKYADR